MRSKKADMLHRVCVEYIRETARVHGVSLEMYLSGLPENAVEHLEDRSPRQLEFAGQAVEIAYQWIGKLAHKLVDKGVKIKAGGIDFTLSLKNLNVDPDDLVGYGALAIINTLRGFDPTYRASTYLKWPIVGAMQREGLRLASMIKLPYNLAERLYKNLATFPLDYAIRETWENLYGERAESLVTIEDVHVAASFLTGRNLVRFHDRSLGNDRYEEIITDPNVKDMIDCADHSRLSESVVTALKELKGKEEIILRMRFGLDEMSERSLDEIAKELNVGRETVRRIENRALRKLRDPVRADILRPFVSSPR